MKNKVCFLFISLLVTAASYAAVPHHSAHKFKDMYDKASNSKLSMNERWQSLLGAAKVADAEELMKIKRFSKNKDWFMRNASLIALDQVGGDMVFDQAQELVGDKSLVVRSAAVDILTRRKNSDTRRLLSAELGKSYNFNKSQSLWIRSQIMKYLTESPQTEDRSFFVKYLYDKDAAVSSMSAQALEKITQIRFAEKNNASVVEQWKKYAKAQKW